MNETQTVVRPIDQVRGELNAEFRSGAEIAERLGMSRYAVGGPLGTLRRRGEVEGMLGAHGESLWRKPSGGDLHGPRSAQSAGEPGDDRQVVVQPNRIQSTHAQR